MESVFGVLQGFALILGVIGVGYLTALFGVVRGEQRYVLNKVAFYVATPALLFTVLYDADPSVLLSPVILVTTIAAVAAAALFVVASRLWFARDLSSTMLGATASGYVNSNNLGLPVAIYILGDAAYVAPLLLVQLVIFTPIVLATLDIARGRTGGALQAIGRAVSNPVVVASVAGLLFSLFGVPMPTLALEPLEMIGAAAIPMMLMSFGMSLHGQAALQPGTGRTAALTASGIKVLIMPLIAWALAVALGLSAHEVFVATTIAALPTAQNVYNYAAIYRSGEITVRDTVFLTTFVALPVIAVISWLLGA